MHIRQLANARGNVPSIVADIALERFADEKSRKLQTQGTSGSCNRSLPFRYVPSFSSNSSTRRYHVSSFHIYETFVRLLLVDIYVLRLISIFRKWQFCLLFVASGSTTEFQILDRSTQF